MDRASVSTETSQREQIDDGGLQPSRIGGKTRTEEPHGLPEAFFHGRFPGLLLAPRLILRQQVRKTNPKLAGFAVPRGVNRHRQAQCGLQGSGDLVIGIAPAFRTGITLALGPRCLRSCRCLFFGPGCWRFGVRCLAVRPRARGCTRSFGRGFFPSMGRFRRIGDFRNRRLLGILRFLFSSLRQVQGFAHHGASDLILLEHVLEGFPVDLLQVDDSPGAAVTSRAPAKSGARSARQSNGQTSVIRART